MAEVETRLIFVCGDLHGSPNPIILAKARAAKPDVVLIGGDIYDAQAFSTHPMNYDEKREYFEGEVRRVQEFFDALSAVSTVEEILLMRGNHEDRILHKLPPDLRAFFKDPLEALTGNKVKLAVQKVTAHYSDDTTYPIGETSYFYLLGDVFCSHLAKTNVEKLNQWIFDWEYAIGLPRIRAALQFHSHKYRHIYHAGQDRHLIEVGSGCLPNTTQYKVGYKANYQPDTGGYVLVRQERSKHHSWKSTMIEHGLLY